MAWAWVFMGAQIRRGLVWSLAIIALVVAAGLALWVLR